MVTASQIQISDITSEGDLRFGQMTFRGELTLRCDLAVSERVFAGGGDILAHGRDIAEQRLRHEIMRELYGNLVEPYMVLSRAVAAMRPFTAPYPGDPVDAALATLKAHIEAMSPLLDPQTAETG